MTDSSMPLVVAMDGPSGTGKSSVSRALAQRLGARYLDTGAIYRIATLHVLRQGIDLADSAAITAAVAALPWSIGTDPSSEQVHLDGADVSEEIRGRRGNQGCLRGVGRTRGSRPAGRHSA